ncbi:M56 family metallopeptidase [Gimesia algae]|uniref:Methicillin resistance mecR1 protein n=1 Tax=Gimesia algae TaxID=2527971 RepID=A0A517VBC2_9PLAN|nr:M56 family metallopeptidase [Gimesia algae]QDT90296.1 Methicillin resistance mecR1 protein [Gimesia algae]
MQEVLNQAAGDWSNWFLHASWQAAVVAGIVFLLLQVTKRFTSAPFRYALLLIVLLKFAVPPFLDLSTGLITQSANYYSTIRNTVVSDPPQISVAEKTSSVTSVASEAGPSNRISPTAGSSVDPVSRSDSATVPTVVEASETAAEFPWSLLLMSVYACGMLVCGVFLVRRYRAILRIVRSGDILNAGELHAEMVRLSTQLNMKKIPALRISDETDAPFAIGVFRPSILFPRLLVESLHPDQRTIVLAHELAHIRRRDLLMGWFETVLSLVWWFHPGMWWLKKSLRQTREDCCDDMLLTHGLADPERYCETLIDAATRQSVRLVEPLVLGFVHREHPVARRIRRLMDGSLLRVDRLRFSALCMVLLVAVLMLPGMRPQRLPVSETSLEGSGGWRNLDFQIDAEEAAVVKKCYEIAQTYFSSNNNEKLFDQPETRQALEAVLQERPDFFYAQQLLGTWYRRRGDLDRANQLLNAALANAPVVLTQKFHTGDQRPLPGLKIPEMIIECNRVQNHSLDPSLKLKYVDLLTDTDGNIKLPVYDTVLRVMGIAHPRGYSIEYDQMGWFESEAANGIMPDVLTWKTWSRPRVFSRTATESYRLRDATGTNTLQLKSDDNTYKIGGVARSEADGRFSIENGKGKRISKLPTDLPTISNAAFMDHAIIELSEPATSQFEIEEINVLDSQTKIPLRRFQDGAGFDWSNEKKIHLFSLWDKLPATVDLILKVYNYQKDSFRYRIPAQTGATISEQGLTLKITHLIAGNHTGWSSRDGFYGEPQSTGHTSEVMFDMTGNSQLKFSLWVVTKEGRKRNLKEGGWFSVGMANAPIRIMLPLEEIDHFEIRPYVTTETIYFEKLQLPTRTSTLGQTLPVIDFAVDGEARQFTSELFSPLRVHFKSLPGKVYSGCSCNQLGYELMERPQEQRGVESQSTVEWHYFAAIDFEHRQEYILTPGSKIKGRQGASNCKSNWGEVSATSKDVPLERIQSVRLQFLPKKSD